MSEEVVREILLKAFDNEEFQKLLLTDPGKAIEGFDLTEVETENLKGLNQVFFDESLALEERVSRGGFLGN